MFTDPTDLRIPGPTPVPPAVMDAMRRPMIPHRGPLFRDFYRETLAMAREIHRTEGDVLLWPASGSAGWELALVNLLSPGDPVLAVVTGSFGDRFAAVAVALGLDVRRLDVEWGRAAEPDDVATALAAQPEIKAVLLTHNETSTGVTNPLLELATVAREHGALVLVDAVSSAAGIPLEVDAWELDCVFSGSQKAWMCPPGLLIVALGPRALGAAAASRFPKVFWDIQRAREAAAEGLAPTTPPLSLLFGFHAALEMMLDEGVEQVWRRHHRLGDLVRGGLRDLGLELLADAKVASDTITAFRPPAHVSADSLIDAVRQTSGIELAAGQGKMTETLVRVGHMGWVEAPELERTLAAIGHVLPALTGASVPELVTAGH